MEQTAYQLSAINSTGKNRIIGFDLARAYAIFGMYVVNFNTVFGSFTDQSVLGRLLRQFDGNSSSTFVILSGMGVALMTNRNEYSAAEKSKLKKVIGRRAWFLLGIGLLLNVWWPADILHFYGEYMHLGLLILFLPKKYYLWAAAVAIIVFHILFKFIPYEKGWNFQTLSYLDFYTLEGFVRNLLYNGWNPVFPWIGFFFMGLWLGRLDWKVFKTQKRIFFVGSMLLTFVYVLRYYAENITANKDLLLYIKASYLPPFLPFMVSALGFALMLLAGWMFLGKRVEDTGTAKLLAFTGQMTLTHYISHLTIGMVFFATITGRSFSFHLDNKTAVAPIYILLFATFYFVASCLFSKWWSEKHKNGPVEMLMRKFSG